MHGFDDWTCHRDTVFNFFGRGYIDLLACKVATVSETQAGSHASTTLMSSFATDYSAAALLLL